MRQVAGPIEADVDRWRAPYMLHNVVPGDDRGAWQRQAVCARVAVPRTITGCADYVVRAMQIPKKRI